VLLVLSGALLGKLLWDSPSLRAQGKDLIQSLWTYSQTSLLENSEPIAIYATSDPDDQVSESSTETHAETPSDPRAPLLAVESSPDTSLLIGDPSDDLGDFKTQEDGNFVLEGHGDTLVEPPKKRDPPRQPPPTPHARPPFPTTPYTGKYRTYGTSYGGPPEPISLVVPPEDATDANARDINLHRKLIDLSMAGGEALTDRGVDYLSGMPELRSLNLSGCTGVTDAGIRPLARVPFLRNLDLSGVPLDGTGFSTFQTHLNLRRVNLAQCQVSDAGLAEISRVRNLRDLTLGGTAVSNRGVGYLRKLPKLQFLDLTGCPGVTTHIMRSLATFPDLRQVSLPASFPRETREALNRAYPRLQIH
jgi:hypothetical protein